ncbi:MAG TPA: RDD family protein [Chryseolinea sp.]
MIVITTDKKNLARRYFANVVDYTFFFVLTFVYVFFFGKEDETGSYHVTGFKALAIPLVWFVYFPVCESLFGQTLGKKAFRLYVVDLQGESPSIIHTFLRRMLDIIEMSFFGIPALIAINHTEKNQRIGDMIAGTTVIATDAVCGHCSAELELLPREVLRNTFTCPSCKQVN